MHKWGFEYFPMFCWIKRWMTETKKWIEKDETQSRKVAHFNGAHESIIVSFQDIYENLLHSNSLGLCKIWYTWLDIDYDQVKKRHENSITRLMQLIKIELVWMKSLLKFFIAFSIHPVQFHEIQLFFTNFLGNSSCLQENPAG